MCFKKKRFWCRKSKKRKQKETANMQVGFKDFHPAHFTHHPKGDHGGIGWSIPCCC